MKLAAIKTSLDFTGKDTIVVFLSDDHQKNRTGLYPEGMNTVMGRANLSLIKGKNGEVVFLPLKDAPTLIISGLGKREEITRESLRNSAGAAIDLCKKKRIKKVAVLIPVLERPAESDVVRSIAEGIYLSNYLFTRYKSRSEESQQRLETADLYMENPDLYGALLKEIEIVCENTLLCRDLVNETSDRSNPLAIADEARRLNRMKGVACRVYGKRDLEKMKMGLITAVSRGSSYPPQMVVLRYRGNPRSKKSLAIVGKGITFDSGGLNLKPTGHIEEMRCDMAGAAVCLYTVRAASELRLRKNLYAVFPLCENMLSRNAYRPGDVHISRNGKSVEIGNTDAEGRLILADALSYTESELRPSYIIDIATLTGACLVAFGEIIAAMLSTDDSLVSTVFDAGEETGERLWRMPLYREYQEDIKSDIADIRNVSSNRNAGTIIGATFLKNFVKSTPWAHLDIAGTAWYSKSRGYRPKNATGFGVRLLIEVLKRIPQ